ncbi:Precorrin-3B C17-methyltransferase [Candidatus Electrothrix laxa]
MTISTTEKTKQSGFLTVVGIGPGAEDLMTPRARQAIEQAEVVAGYKTYLDLIRHCILPEQDVLSSAMMQEIDRCRRALELADSGKTVVLVCGGDPGIYAMAGLVYELVRDSESPSRIEIIPGIAALNACAAVLGAPLMHDFAAISLSDLMTPWELIEKRLQAAASADFVTVIYNPKSKKRTEQIVRAQEIMLEYRDPQTPVGIVSGASREHESVCLTTLEAMLDKDIGMQTTVIVGNSATFIFGDKMVTPRGYSAKYGLAEEGKRLGR